MFLAASYFCLPLHAQVQDIDISDVESSLSCGCQVVEPTLFCSTSSFSNNSYYQSEFDTIPYETENFSYDHTDSESRVSETPGTLLLLQISLLYIFSNAILAYLYVLF